MVQICNKLGGQASFSQAIMNSDDTHMPTTDNTDKDGIRKDRLPRGDDL